MATKRDQLQSYQFLVQRLVTALVTRETDPEQPPFRRSTVGAIGSIVLAVLVLTGFGVYGLIVPGGKDSWRSGDVVIVEKETGTRYVFVAGRLHPVANYVSALLVLERYAPIRSVSRRSLVDVPRGPRIGIPDAPDSLPDRRQLLTGSWSMCSQPVVDDTGAEVDESVLMVGRQPASGQRLGDSALLVEVPETGEQYLLWRGFRHRIRAEDKVVVGLALQSEPWARIGVELIDALPAGAPLSPVALPDLGADSSAIEGRYLRIGQLMLLETAGGVRQYYLVEASRLRPISALQYDIQVAYPATSDAYDGEQPEALPLDAVEAAESTQGPRVATTPGAPPLVRPAFLGARETGSALCATFAPSRPVPDLTVDAVMPARDPMTLTSGRTVRGTPLADRVVVPPGRVAVVETMPSPAAPVGALSVVTDLGVQHPVAGPDVLATLGFDGVTPVRMPASLVARIPATSGLDPAAVMRQLTS